MIIPVRCFSCGHVVSDKYEEFVERSKEEDPKDVLDSLGLNRYCCRRMILGHMDFMDELIRYEKGP